MVYIRYYPEVKVLVKFPKGNLKYEGFSSNHHSFGSLKFAKSFVADVKQSYKKARIPAKFRIVKRRSNW